MTQQQLIEIVQQHHPNMGETELRLALNRAQDDYCSQTELIKKTSTLTSVAGQRYYTIASNILRIMSVQFNDVKIPRLIGSPLIDDDEHTPPGLATPTSSTNERYWFVDTARLGIVEKIVGSVTRDDKQSNYQSCSVAGKEIRLFCITQATDYTTDLTEVSELPSQFHIALAYKVISDAYLRAGLEMFNPKVSQVFDLKYKELVKDGRKHSRADFVQGTTLIKPTEF
jgi:hypothetical protein